MKHRLALIGGRGYTGGAFLNLLATNPSIGLAMATSSSQAGTALQQVAPEWPDPGESFRLLEPGQVGDVAADVWVLALPNGHSAAWVAAIDQAHRDALVLDMGADYRFDPDWTYGLTEANRLALSHTRRIANPGCYATAAQFGLLPLAGMLDGPPVVFGVSGCSGAGRAPSPRNDPARLADNLIPYSLTGHVHEREISARLGVDVRFHPHVAPFFRGLSLTITVSLNVPTSAADLHARYHERWGGEPLVRVGEGIPEIREVVGTPAVHIGGFSVDERDPRRASLVVVLDNLLKGAASQALQNIHLALGLAESVDGGDQRP